MIRTTALLAALALLFLGAGSALAADGDYNGDGAVDQLDVQILTDAVGTTDGDPGFLPEGDYDGDGVITLQDVSQHLKLAQQ